MAEAERVERPSPFGSSVFKTDAIAGYWLALPQCVLCWLVHYHTRSPRLIGHPAKGGGFCCNTSSGGAGRIRTTDAKFFRLSLFHWSYRTLNRMESYRPSAVIVSFTCFKQVLIDRIEYLL